MAGGINMILFVVRHGETDYNIQQRYAGSTDVPLNNAGIRQAEEIARQLAQTRFDVIVSSPLKRALETAQIIKEYHTETPFIIINEFAERSVGVYEGITRDEARSRFPELWARQCTSKLDDAPTNGETLRQVDDRITIGMNKIKEKYADKTVLLVCHGFVSRAINRQINNIPFDEMHSFTLENCQIATYKL